MKILNLYSGIGGNRKLWPAEHQVTSVEYDPDIAAVYADLYPQDELIVGDAHEYLRVNHRKFDFIWSSPPCQTHSSIRFNLQVKLRGAEEKYADMKLYEEILFLQHHSSATWVVENVAPYYDVLIPAQRINRHLYWANFTLPSLPQHHENLRSIQIADLEKLHGFDLSKYKLANKRQVLRNCVPPLTGLRIFEAAFAEDAADFELDIPA
jgi:DNA (cytosine-5)-methyltransferase 1